MRSGCPCIVESNFETGGRAASRLKELGGKYGSLAVEILLTADPKNLQARYRARLGSRHPGRVDHLKPGEQSAKRVNGLQGSLDLGGERVSAWTRCTPVSLNRTLC